MPTKPDPVTIRMTVDKETKGTIRFATKDEEAPIQQVYVSKPWASQLPGTIELTIKPV